MLKLYKKGTKSYAVISCSSTKNPKRFGLTEHVFQLRVKFEGEKTCSFYSDNKPLLSLDMAPNILQLVELK